VIALKNLSDARQNNPQTLTVFDSILRIIHVSEKVNKLIEEMIEKTGNL
jgi:hypothetical protein